MNNLFSSHIPRFMGLCAFLCDALSGALCLLGAGRRGQLSLPRMPTACPTCALRHGEPFGGQHHGDLPAAISSASAVCRSFGSGGQRSVGGA